MPRMVFNPRIQDNVAVPDDMPDDEVQAIFMEADAEQRSAQGYPPVANLAQFLGGMYAQQQQFQPQTTLPNISGKDTYGMSPEQTANLIGTFQQDAQSKVDQQFKMRAENERKMEAEKDRSQQLKLEAARMKNDAMDRKLREQQHKETVGIQQQQVDATVEDNKADRVHQSDMLRVNERGNELSAGAAASQLAETVRGNIADDEHRTKMLEATTSKAEYGQTPIVQMIDGKRKLVSMEYPQTGGAPIPHVLGDAPPERAVYTGKVLDETTGKEVTRRYFPDGTYEDLPGTPFRASGAGGGDGKSRKEYRETNVPKKMAGQFGEEVNITRFMTANPKIKDRTFARQKLLEQVVAEVDAEYDTMNPSPGGGTNSGAGIFTDKNGNKTTIKFGTVRDGWTAKDKGDGTVVWSKQ